MPFRRSGIQEAFSGTDTYTLVFYRMDSSVAPQRIQTAHEIIRIYILHLYNYEW